jgi:hypothetical protein
MSDHLVRPSHSLSFILIFLCISFDRLCGLVVRVLGYRYGGLGSIPGTTGFSEKKKKKGKQVVGLGLENRDYGHKGSAALTMRHPSILKSWH